VRRALDGAAADLLFTDPPYNVAYDGGRPGTRGVAQKRIAGDDVEQGEYERWLERVLAAACGSLRAGGAFYIWNGFRQFGPMVTALESAGGRVSTVLTWAKETFALGYGDYNQQTEFCIYGWMPAARGRHAWHGPPSESTLWRVARDAAGGPDAHPTRKPVELAERAINNSTRRNQTVLDCFLGGGSTLVAAERTGRRCVGIEIDPRWCDAAVRRWIALVGPNRAGHDLVERYAEARA
jgi:DNA modification methylase